jgi:hypothetical protein
MKVEVNLRDCSMTIGGMPVTLNEDGKVRVGGAVPRLWQVMAIAQHHPSPRIARAASGTTRKVMELPR